MPTPPDGPVAVTRRRVLLGGLGLAAVGPTVAGCTFVADGPAPGAEPTAPSTPTEESVDADADLVADVLAEIAATRALVVVVRRRQPSLAGELMPLQRVHAAHGRALGDLPGATGRPTVPQDASAARAAVVAAEQALQSRVATAMGAARSGTLAAVLGSVVASLAQHLATLGAGAAG